MNKTEDYRDECSHGHAYSCRRCSHHWSWCLYFCGRCNYSSHNCITQCNPPFSPIGMCAALVIFSRIPIMVIACRQSPPLLAQQKLYRGAQSYHIQALYHIACIVLAHISKRAAMCIWPLLSKNNYQWRTGCDDEVSEWWQNILIITKTPFQESNFEETPSIHFLCHMSHPWRWSEEARCSDPLNITELFLMTLQVVTTTLLFKWRRWLAGIFWLVGVSSWLAWVSSWLIWNLAGWLESPWLAGVCFQFVAEFVAWSWLALFLAGWAP